MSILDLLALCALVLPAALAQTTPSASCATGVHFIGGSGHGNAPSDFGFLSSLAANVLNTIPGSTNYSVPYDKVSPSLRTALLHVTLLIVCQQSTDYPTAVYSGTTLFTSVVKDYVASCPNSKVVVAGYSEVGQTANLDLQNARTTQSYTPGRQAHGNRADISVTRVLFSR